MAKCKNRHDNQAKIDYVFKCLNEEQIKRTGAAKAAKISNPRLSMLAKDKTLVAKLSSQKLDELCKHYAALASKITQ